jgi:hypothetical protein
MEGHSWSATTQEERETMLCITSSVHDPVALAATCRRLGLSPPEEGSVHLDGRVVFGWVVYLNGLHGPLVFDTLTGLVRYDPRDNGFGPFARIKRLVLRYYDVRAELQRGDSGAALQRGGSRVARRPFARRRPVQVLEVAT